MHSSEAVAGSLLESAHHDGSSLYVPEPPKEHGDPFTVLLRVPRAEGASQVVVRQVHDGEQNAVPARIDRETEAEVWWRADLTAHNTLSHYRFLLNSGPNRYRWVHSAGTTDNDLPDHHDFRVSLHSELPDWVPDAVLYQIFPDRFARSGRVTDVPDWAEPAGWDDVTAFRGRSTGRQFYGGDLYGIAEHLDHIATLGANTLYLTPVFPARSNHRYNAESFERVDPFLGGDAAYRELIDAVHARGMRIIGDLTTNHTGSTHDWFTRAATPDAPERGFYFFDREADDFVFWLGVRSLPKLDLENDELRRRLVEGRDSTVANWVRFGLDGWRIDVANMTGRYQGRDVNAEVARVIRQTLRDEAGTDAYLVGEHFHDYLQDVDGSTWQGIMNYSGFTKPMWNWLVRPEARFDSWLGIPLEFWPQLPGASVVETMRLFSSIPWPARLGSMSIISSHDSPRIATITDSAALVEVAAAAMFTMPGVPMIWAGDEIGMEGVTGEDGRRPFPWHRPETWNRGLLRCYGDFVTIRRDSEALRRGGLRWAFVDEDRLVFLREHPTESVLVMLARAPGDPIPLSGPLLGMADKQEAEALYGGATLRAEAGRVILPGDGPAVHIWRMSPK